MTVRQTGKEFNTKDFIGLSTDTKPVNCGAGSSFLELDTKNVYVFDTVNWILL